LRRQPKRPRRRREPADESNGRPSRGCVPPLTAARLLRRCLPPGLVGESILGDLRQEFEERAITSTPRALRTWYRRQAAKLAVRYTWERARLALQRRGAPDTAKPTNRRGDGLHMETLVQDARFGARTLLSNPGFTAVAVITLALGIGANAAMFSVINAVLLRPLDFPEPERLVAVKRRDLVDAESGANTTPANFIAWTERATSFAAMATIGNDIAALTGRGEARRVIGLRSAGSLHEVLATPPLFGRLITRADDAAGNNVVVLSHGLWRRLYGDDRDILGDSVVLDDVPHTIIGVMPPDFDFRYYADRDVDFWAPSGWSDEYRQERGNYAHQVVARLAPGVTVERAQEEMEAIAAQLRAEFPVANRNHGVAVVPLHEELVAGSGSLLLLLMGAVALVLLIATVNLANLLLARASSREQEIAVRRAIGATPGRLARQILTESVLLSTLGGAAGLAMAVLAVDAVASMIPAEIPYVDRVSIDPTVLAFTFGIATLAGLTFGMIPAFRLSRRGVADTLGGRGRGSSRSSWTWSTLVVAEVALSVVLLVGAGLLLRSFVNLMRVDPGFAPERVLTFTVSLPSDFEPERRLNAWRRMREELATLPSVTAAAVANQLPAEPNRVSGWFNYVDHPVEIDDRSFLVPYRLVSPGYFEALGIPLVRGRGLEAADGNEPIGVVVNEAAVRRFWPDAEPLGDRIGIGSLEGESWYPPATVVGVVGDVRNAGLAEESEPAVYFPIEMGGGWTNMTFALRTVGEPTALLRAARDRIRAVAPSAPVFNELTAEQMLAAQVAPTRAIMQLIGTFAGVGLAMAAIGVFGVLSYSVSRRTREMGIRTALGADARRLTSMVVGQAMARVLAGTALGIVAAIACGRLLSGMLFEVSTVDPITMTGVTLLLCLAALLASYLPARRATRVDPTVALRSD
jgi:putative ABC transport system permease protein